MENNQRKAYLIGGGIASMAAAAFMIRDGKISGQNIHILEAGALMGGSLDAGGNPETGYIFRGGRMFTLDNFECTWDLFKTIPSLNDPNKTVYNEVVDFCNLHQSNAKARLVDSHCEKLPVKSMSFSMRNRLELYKLSKASEEKLGNKSITDCLSPSFFDTKFWFMWSTTFAFQPWHSAVEFNRYLNRFMLEFSRIDTLAGIKRTPYAQYNSMVLPLQRWLTEKGVHIINNCTVTDIVHSTTNNEFTVTALKCTTNGTNEVIEVAPIDLVFLQNGSMTDASSIGSMTMAPAKHTKTHSGSWALWEKLAHGHPQFGNPAAFNSSIAKSCWHSFTVTLKNPYFFDQMKEFSANEPGIGGLVTFKDSNWLMSIVLPHQPHILDQPKDVQVFWGYALYTDRVGNFVSKPMDECNGAEIMQEICGHLRFDLDAVQPAICIPCRMPYITSMFMPRHHSDRPLPVPQGSRNFAFISQFVEIPDDVVFTVEYSVRAAQMAVYQLLAITRPVPPVTPYNKLLRVQFQALVKAFK